MFFEQENSGLCLKTKILNLKKANSQVTFLHL